MAEPPENASRSARDEDRPSLWAGLRGRISVAAIKAIRGLVWVLPRERALWLGGTLGRAYARLHGPRTGTARINLAHCPFIDLAKKNPAVVCGIHRGLIAGAMEQLGEGEAEVSLEPFVAPNLCRAHVTASLPLRP